MDRDDFFEKMKHYCELNNMHFSEGGGKFRCASVTITIPDYSDLDPIWITYPYDYVEENTWEVLVSEIGDKLTRDVDFYRDLAYDVYKVLISLKSVS